MFYSSGIIKSKESVPKVKICEYFALASVLSAWLSPAVLAGGHAGIQVRPFIYYEGLTTCPVRQGFHTHFFYYFSATLRLGAK